MSDLLERLAAIQERGGRAVLFTVVEGDGAGAKFLVEEGETDSELAAEADEVIRGARNALLELPGREGVRRGLHAAPAAVRLRRGRHRRGALQGGQAARLEHLRRRRPARVRHRASASPAPTT